MWIQRKFGPSNGIFAVEERPEGEAAYRRLLVTLPGLSQAMSEKNYMFSTLRKRLAAQGQWTVQFDYRGHGDSEGELGEATIAGMLEDAWTVVTEAIAGHPVETVVFAGHALGALIAQMAAVRTAERLGLRCVPVLVSPPLCRLPAASTIFDAETLARLAREGALDAKLLVSGSDYYTLSDFDPAQFDYFRRLGAHMLYLHGQRIGRALLDELDELDPQALLSALPEKHMIIGSRDKESLALAHEVPGAAVSQIPDVTRYFEHPAAMDHVITLIAKAVGTQPGGEAL